MATSQTTALPDNPSNSNYFTDVIVNLDGNKVFTNFSSQFPTGGAVVEAARGNLENPNYIAGAGINLTTLGYPGLGNPLQVGASPGPNLTGSLAAYRTAARLVIQPMNTVQNAVAGFMSQLATASAVHFGLIAFNDYTGSDANTIWPSTNTTPNSSTQSAPYNIANCFPYPSVNPDDSISATNSYPIPNIQLNPSSNGTQSTINTTLPTLPVLGNRNVAAALQAAIDELTAGGSSAPTYARSGSSKAIILITTGPPNVDLSDSYGATALSDALNQAQTASAAGIPIYCISIAQLTSDATNEDSAYNDNNGGIVATAGHGGKYYRINWTDSATTQTALTTAFANISRHLIPEVH